MYIYSYIMKKFYTLYILLGAVILTSADYTTDKDSIHQPFKKQEIMNTNQNNKKVRRLYDDCLNKRNYALMKELFDDNFMGEVVAAEGPDGFEHTIRPLIQSFPDIQWKVDDLLAEGDEVVVRHSWIGTQ